MVRILPSKKKKNMVRILLNRRGDTFFFFNDPKKSEKLAIFCLFATLKMIRKIFFGVWLLIENHEIFLIFSYNLRSCEEKRDNKKNLRMKNVRE
jgi:hypothetical protein